MTIPHLLIFLVVIYHIPPHHHHVQAQGDGDGTTSTVDWIFMTQYVLAFSFVVIGLYLRLYSPIAINYLMRRYVSKGISVQGQVLSFKPSNVGTTSTSNDDKNYTIRTNNQADVLYEMPNGKRYLRTYDIQQEAQRGSVVELLVLPGRPKSGMLKETVESLLMNHSHLGVFLFLFPGLVLIGFILWMLFDKTTKMRSQRIILIAVMLNIVFVSYLFTNSRWRKQRDTRFFSARPVQTLRDDVPTHAIAVTTNHFI